MKMLPPATSRASFRPLSSAHHPQTSSSRGRVEAAHPFAAFIAYADVPAAGRAMGTVNEVLGALQKKHTLTPMLWRFSQLIDPKWREAAIADAAQANVVVLASTSATTLTPELEAWVGTFLARRRGLRTTLVSLFGQEDAWTISIEESAAIAEPQRLVA